MNLVCLDLEGVLVPETWRVLSEATGVPELMLTTRDEPDYDKLMRMRIDVMKAHGIGIREMDAAVETIEPYKGAKEFLDSLRSVAQVIIISDIFIEFTGPIMRKLGYPTIFCNSLEINERGEITGYHMRVKETKLSTVKALQSIGFETIAAGDSYNDLGMIRASKAGFLFRSTDEIKAANPDIPTVEGYPEFLEAIKNAL